MSPLSSRMRQAGRALARRPLYAAVAVVTVAAGIAAWTAAFVLVDAALLSPLPFAAPERLVTPDVISTRGFPISISIPNYRDWSTQSRVFASTGASAGWDVVLTGRGAARTLVARETYGDFFGTLGLAPALGRLFAAADTERGAAPTAVLGDAFFRELGGDPQLVGSTLTLDGRAYEVIGVLPPGVGYPSRATEIYLPLGALGDDIPWDDRDSGFGLRLIGRLAPGATLEAAQRDLERVAEGIRKLAGHEVEQPRLRALSDIFVGDLRRPLLLLFAAAALVVALALANVANLFLARSEARRSELAIRAALGAPRWDLVRLQFAESVWITAAGALLGTLGAVGLLALFGDRIAADVPRFVAERLHVGPAAVAFALGLAALAALLLAVVPALVVPRGAAADALHGARAGSSRASTRFRSGLVVGELALGTVLVVGAALLGASLDRLRHVDKGFDATGVVAGRVASPSGKFADAAAWLAFQRRLLERAGALPGARSAALSLLLPLGDRSWEMGLVPEGKPFDREHSDSVLYNIVSERFFETLRIPLLRGRLFGPDDRDGGELVTVVDESLAERYWPGQDPLGKRVAFETAGAMHGPDAKPVYRTIVGVVKNLRHYELQSPSRIQVYIPLEQANGRWGIDLELAIRTDGAVTPLVAQLPKLVAELDPDVPTSDTAPLAASLDRAVAQPALLSRTVASLGALALLLAAVGVFALASFGVEQRRREIGVRQALGATPRAILGDVLARATRWSLWGVGLGAIAAAGAARLARTLLWGVAGFEPGAYAGSLGLLVASALLAGAIPALRAARIDPARTLRDDT